MVRNKIIGTLILLSLTTAIRAQDVIPLDTSNWNIRARSYVTEKFKGKDAIYLKGGSILLKNKKFLNGTIEYDVYLKEEHAFPGVYFRAYASHAEQFFLRPHLSGKPDANQAAPLVNGVTPFQLYFGPKYSFAYEYNYNDWTHVKLVVNGDRAQVYLDYAEKPNLSWKLFHETRAGAIVLTAGGASAFHLADIKIDESATEIVDFSPIEREPIEGLVPEWQVSDKFEEKLLDDHAQLRSLINGRKWNKKIEVEEGTAANISRAVLLRDGTPSNTVFAKITINSDKKETRIFQFGYSDRVVAILNGKPIYRGTTKWRSRDYRYLGTVGLFDSVYLDLKKGENTLLFAVSEDFGGWLITGKFADDSGLTIK